MQPTRELSLQWGLRRVLRAHRPARDHHARGWRAKRKHAHRRDGSFDSADHAGRPAQVTRPSFATSRPACTSSSSSHLPARLVGEPGGYLWRRDSAGHLSGPGTIGGSIVAAPALASVDQPALSSPPASADRLALSSADPLSLALPPASADQLASIEAKSRPGLVLRPRADLPCTPCG